MKTTRLARLRFLFRRPSQWSVRGFRFVPLLLFGVGTCALLYGGFFHRLPVVQTREEEYQEAVPVEPAAPLGALPGMGAYVPYGAPPMSEDDAPSKPPLEFVTKIRTVETTAVEPEWNVNVLMTFGGIARDERGKLVRLMTDTEGPAFCPS
jgi:hypothetical protein